MKVYLSAFNTLYIEIKYKFFKKTPPNKVNGTKNALFFLSRAPTQHSFAFNLQVLYKLKHKLCLFKSVFGILHLWFCFVFIKAYILVQQNTYTLDFKNVIIAFKIKIIKKPYKAFSSTLSCKIKWCLCELELPKNWPGDKFFRLWKSNLWERQFFSVVTFK